MKKLLLLLAISVLCLGSAEAQLETYTLPETNVVVENINTGAYFVSIGHSTYGATVEVTSDTGQNINTTGSGRTSWVVNQYVVYTSDLQIPPPSTIYVHWGDAYSELSTSIGGASGTYATSGATVANVSNPSATFIYPSLAAHSAETIFPWGSLTGTPGGGVSPLATVSSWSPTWTQTSSTTWQSSVIHVQMPSVSAAIIALGNSSLVQGTAFASIAAPFLISLTS